MKEWTYLKETLLRVPNVLLLAVDGIGIKVPVAAGTCRLALGPPAGPLDEVFVLVRSAGRGRDVAVAAVLLLARLSLGPRARHLLLLLPAARRLLAPRRGLHLAACRLLLAAARLAPRRRSRHSARGRGVGLRRGDRPEPARNRWRLLVAGPNDLLPANHRAR